MPTSAPDDLEFLALRHPKQPTPDGQTLHGDHAYVFYQIPVNRRKLPLVFLHGTGQFSKTWETTPDGREGFQTSFIRRRFPVYVIDQPRRAVSATIETTPDEQAWFDTFRVGIWPDYFPGIQFSKDPEALNQYFRQMTPNADPYEPVVISDACAALFNKTGPAIFVTHSQGGGLGWMTAHKAGIVRGIVSHGPGSGFLFPEGDVPEPLASSGGPLAAIGVPMAEFTKLTKIPITIFYGDFIPKKPSDIPGQDGWRVRLETARKWLDTVNPHGGDVTIVHLPEVGIHGNANSAGNCGGCLDLTAVNTAAGTVEKIRMGIGIQMPSLVVKTSAGALVSIKLGPERVLLGADFELEAGDIVSAKYAHETCTDENVALQLTNSAGVTITLRNSDGTPNWN